MTNSHPAEAPNVDDILEDSFPASDPPSWTLGVGPEGPPDDPRKPGAPTDPDPAQRPLGESSAEYDSPARR